MEPWIAKVSELLIRRDDPHAAEFCTCCGRELKGKVRMLELDQRTDTYHDNGDVPEDWSQGWFPFGLACAKRVLAAHRAKTK